MARYDRIAPLSSPEREKAFPCWPVLRDVEGQDRDADVCRRARLRFLALRPVRRLADGLPNEVNADSFNRQLDLVREELRGLSAHDADRVRITQFLRQIEERDPQRIVSALLDFAEQAHAAGHVFAAHEYAATAEDIAAGCAAELRARMQADDDTVQSDPAALLETAWNELRQTDDVSRRTVMLERIGRALIGLQLLNAAERCFAMFTQRQAEFPVRSRARAAYALLAALQERPELFRERRAGMLSDASEWSADPRVAATVHTDLAHGCVLAGDFDFARDHVRSALTIARRHNYTAPLQRAEGILAALEQKSELQLRPRATSSEIVQRIVAQIESLDLPRPAAS